MIDVILFAGLVAVLIYVGTIHVWAKRLTDTMNENTTNYNKELLDHRARLKTLEKAAPHK